MIDRNSFFHHLVCIFNMIFIKQFNFDQGCHKVRKNYDKRKKKDKSREKMGVFEKIYEI